MRATIVPLALALSACATTWNDAVERADSPIIEAELALIAGRDPTRAATLAENIIESDKFAQPIQLRAFSLLLAASDALADFERPLAHLPAAIDAAIAARDPALAARFAAQTNRAWGRLDGRPADSPEVRAALERLAALPGDLWAPARQAARRELITAARLTRGPAAARDAALAAGYLLDWRLSAPWGDAPALDFSRPLGPETRPLGDAESTGAGWATAPVATTRGTFSDGEVTFFDMPTSGGVGFAEATLELTSPAAELALESNRLAALWVGGAPVLTRSDLGASTLATTSLALGPGRHRLLVKLATHDGKGFFRLRATPLDTLPRPPAAPILPTLRVGVPAPFVDALLDLEDSLSRPRLDPRHARLALATLERLLGPHPAVDLLAARFALTDASSPEAERRELARERYSRIVARFPLHAGAKRGLARLEREASRLDQALALLDDRADPRTALDVLQIHRSRGWEVESLALASTLVPLAEASPRVAQELIDTYRAFGRLDYALALAQSLDARFPGAAMDRLAELLADRGVPPISAQLTQLSAEPQRHALLRATLANLRAVGQLDTAETLLSDFLDSRPEDGWALAELARIALQRGEVGLALDRLRRTLDHHPDFAPLESLSSQLEGGPEPFDTLEDGRAVLARWRAVANAETARYPIVQLLERTRVDVRADGSTLELVHRVRLIQSKQGADALGDVRPPDGARLLVARTLKADGRVLDPERTAGKADLSFPELAPGDAVETAWVSRSRVTPGEGGYLTGVSFAGWGSPIFELDASFSTAPGLDLVVTSFGNPPAPTRETSPEGTRLTWTLRNLPALPREPLAISARSFFPFADLRVVSTLRGPSSEAAWQAIARAYASRLAFLTDARGARLAARVAQFAREKNPIAAAFGFVKSDIADLEQLNAFETPVEQALASRRGNRALVLAALLKAMRTEAELLLCAPERDGPPEDRAEPTPNPNRFFYPVVSVGGLYLDPARPYTPTGDLPAELAHARCFIPQRVDSAASLFVDLPALAARPAFTLEGELALSPSGDAKGRLMLSAQGAAASPLRQAFLAQDDTRKQILLEQWLGAILVGARLIDFEGRDLTSSDRPFVLVMNLEVPGWARQVQGASGPRLVIDKPLTPLFAADLAGVPDLADLIGLPTRATPLRVLPHHEHLRLTVVAPANIPPLARAPLTTPAVSQSVDIAGSKLTLSREVLLAPGRVEPSEYAKFREAMTAAIRALEQPLEFGR